jgi:hypothetical protein
LSSQCLSIGISFIQAFLSGNQSELTKLNQTFYNSCISLASQTTLLQQEMTTASPDFVQELPEVGLDTLFSSLSKIFELYSILISKIMKALLL